MTGRRLHPDFLVPFAAWLAIGAFLLREIYDLDIWWQVAIGREILASGNVPFTDAFAAAALGRPYHDSHWAFQVLMALADRLAGMAGVQAVMVALWALTLAFCQQAIRRWVSPLAAGLLLFLAAMTSIERFLPRPEIVTFLMVAVFYLQLQEERFRTWGHVLLLALLQLIWTNSHGLFVIGPFMVGCYWLAALAERLRRGASAHFRALSRLLAVVTAATFVTPGIFAGWQYAFLLFSEVGPEAPQALASLGELSPVFGAATRSGVAFWFYAALLLLSAVTALFLLYRRRPVDAARLLLLLGLLAASLTGRRNIVLFALVAAPWLAENLRHARPMALPLRRGFAWALALALAGWSIFPLSGRYDLLLQIPARVGYGATPSFYPHALPAFLERIGFQGQVFNSNTLGGFYLYHRHPTAIPLTDGRWEIYSGATLDRIMAAPGSPAAWQKLVADYDIRGLLLAHTSPEAEKLLPRLPQDVGWRLVYLDHAASFWLRADLGRDLPQLDLSDPRLLPVAAVRVDDRLILDNFFARTGAESLQLENLRHLLAAGYQREGTLERIGDLQMRLGLTPEAEATFLLLNREFPENVRALNELAFFAYQRRDLGTAKQMLIEALAVNPDDQNTAANLEIIRQAMAVGPAPGGRNQ